MDVGRKLTALDDNVAQRWPALFSDSLRSRAWTIVAFQSIALICMFVGLATGSQAVVGGMSAALVGTLGIGIRLLRHPPANG